MIQTRELRIGNIVGVFRTQTLEKMTEPTIGKVQQIRFNKKFNYYQFQVPEYSGLVLIGESDLQPIALIPEWMLKFGFQLFPWGWVKKSTDDVGLRITHHFCFERQGEKSLKIEYVHELQNLWFVHTKEELS